MAAAGVDGVWKQRFVHGLSNAKSLKFNDRVWQNVADAAAAPGGGRGM
eukprot:gene17833-biopygen41550